MMPVGLADAAHPLQGVLVADVTAERVAGIGRIGDYAARAHDFGRAADESRLRGDGCNSKYWLTSDALSAMIRGLCRGRRLTHGRNAGMLEFAPLAVFFVAYYRPGCMSQRPRSWRRWRCC